LIVDAAQSIQAQTISNLYLAENDLEIIPVLIKWITKCQPEEVSDIVDLLGCKLEEIIHASENWFRCRKYIGSDYRKNSSSKGNVRRPLPLILILITIHSVELKLFSV
jgi:GTP-binding protein LepA